MAKPEEPGGAGRSVDALAHRLHVLEQERGCCVDVQALVAALPPLDAALETHRALADPGRLAIVALLARTPDLCGCEFQAALGLSHATVSHHMRIMQEAGLVRADRRGRWVHYSLTEHGQHLAP